MDERLEDAREKTKALERLLKSGAGPDELFAAASKARLALEFRASDAMIGLGAVDPDVLDALREATKKALAAAADRSHVEAAIELGQWAFDERDETAATDAVRGLARMADTE